MFASLHPIHPAEALTREQAVEAYTFGSAYAAFAERDRGRLEPGKLADMAVLSQDIFVIPPDALPATHSVLTIIGGEIVHGSLPLAEREHPERPTGKRNRTLRDDVRER